MKENKKLKEQIKALEGVEKAYLSLHNKYSTEEGISTSNSFLREAAEVRKQINQLKANIKK